MQQPCGGRTDMRGIKFLIAGGLNTVLTYIIYLGLVQVLPYPVAYTVTYLLGIAFGYLVNAYWVFGGKASVRSALGYPAAYALNYLLGLGLLAALVEVAGVDKRLAPLVVVVFTTPVMYLFSKHIFSRDRQ